MIGGSAKFQHVEIPTGGKAGMMHVNVRMAGFSENRITAGYNDPCREPTAGCKMIHSYNMEDHPT